MSEEEKPPLKLANEKGNENPWYVLMTIAGEQAEDDFDWKRHTKNRRYWNGWVAQVLSEEEKNKLIEEKRATTEDLALLTERENEKIEEEIKRRCPKREIPYPKDGVDFSSTKFDNIFLCEGFIFPSSVHAWNAEFSGKVNFRDAIFSSSAHFQYAIFSSLVNFRKATFLDDAIFEGATFTQSSQVNFSYTKFANRGLFKYAIFSSLTSFSNATFSEESIFTCATFSNDANFASVVFSSWTLFENATFSNPVEKDANLESKRYLGEIVFNDAKFEGATNFKNAKFNGFPPRFYNADLHEDTDWTGIKWPNAPKKKNATEYRRAYERLKLIMAQQNKFHDEHLFLRKELRCREINEPYSLRMFFSRVYRWTSNYGWSITQPLAALAIFWLLGWRFIGCLEAGYVCKGWGAVEVVLDIKNFIFWESAGLSFSNIFGFLGLEKYLSSITLEKLATASKVISGAQTFLGLIFLFLLFLALRNHFRIK